MRLKHLPSMDLLRSFEAVARHLSFTKAANELFVTQSAVSRQIKMLEEYLNTSLFLRGIRKITLTESGIRLYQCVDTVLRQLEIVSSEITSPQKQPLISLSTTASFSSLWLIPRLIRFNTKYPNINIKVSATSEIQHVRQGYVDLAIRYARPESIPVGARILFHENVFAICSQNFLKKKDIPPLLKPEHLQNHTLLHMDDPRGEWPWYSWDAWLAKMGLPHLRPTGMIRFSQYDHMIQATLSGQGIALGRYPLINHLLTEKKLVKLFNEPATDSGTHYLIVSPESDRDIHISCFINWLFDEISADI